MWASAPPIEYANAYEFAENRCKAIMLCCMTSPTRLRRATSPFRGGFWEGTPSFLEFPAFQNRLLVAAVVFFVFLVALDPVVVHLMLAHEA